MVTNKCAQIYGHHDSAQMDGLQAIPDPLDRSTFNERGGSGMVVLLKPPLDRCRLHRPADPPPP
jgi:hypothetical protein